MATCLEQLGRHYDMPNDPVTTQGYHWHKVGQPHCATLLWEMPCRPYPQVLIASPPENRPRAVCMNDLAAIYHGLSITQAIPPSVPEAQLMTVDEVCCRVIVVG